MACIEITTRIGCRNNCVYCPQEKLVKAYSARSNEYVLSFDTFKTCVDKLPKETGIEFSGFSEPWLNPECTRMAEYAYNRGHEISAFTTLVGMEQHNVDRIKNLKFNRFWIHLPSNEDCEKILVDDKYLNILEKIFSWLEQGGRAKNISYHVRGRDVDQKVKEILGDKIKSRGISTRAGNIGELESKMPKRKAGKIRCATNLTKNVLLPNGEVVICCMDYDLKHVLGNLLKQDYPDLFQSEEFKKIKAGLSDEKQDILCRYCDMFACNVNWKAKVFNNLRELSEPGGIKKVIRKFK